MKLYKNYKKEGFYQIIPLYLIKDENQFVILLGFGTKNISLAFSNTKSNSTASKTAILPSLPKLSVFNKEQPISEKRWKAKVDKINNTIRVEEDEKPVKKPKGSAPVSTTTTKLSPEVMKTILIVGGAVAIGAIGYYLYKKRKK